MAGATSSQSKRLLQLLNYLGFLNLLGILSIIASERLPSPTNEQFPLRASSIRSSQSKTQPTNRHKGINETVLFLQQAGIDIDIDYPRLPPWWWIEDQYGEEPVVLGLDRCQHFRHLNQNHLDDITIAPTGLFNSGTNLLHQLLQLNCHFPDRDTTKAYHGYAFQPPWGKHTPREFRGKHTISGNNTLLYQSMVVDAVLPVVLVRHPYDWFKSMCEQPYGAHWVDRDGRNVQFFSDSFLCPGLVHKYSESGGIDGNDTYPMTVEYGSGMQEYESIAHLYNRWNRAWFDTLSVPRLVVRMEDLIFHPQKVVPEICHCAGGTLLHNNIQVPLESAKQDQAGHRAKRTTFLKAVVKYGNLRTWERFPIQDHVAARAVLDKELIDNFHYQHPDWNTVTRNKERQGLV
jgi:hypothetical protein